MNENTNAEKLLELTPEEIEKILAEIPLIEIEDLLKVLDEEPKND